MSGPPYFFLKMTRNLRGGKRGSRNHRHAVYGRQSVCNTCTSAVAKIHTRCYERGVFSDSRSCWTNKLPYRPMASQHAKAFLDLHQTFLDLHQTDSIDGRKWIPTIETPDVRGGIRFAGGSIMIRDPTLSARSTAPFRSMCAT